MYTFVTGGLRSGRSSYALRRAAELGPPPWVYVTPGEETDEAIRKMIERHRRDKEAIWRTVVMPRDPMALFEPGALEGIGALVLDGLPAWVAHRIEAGADDRTVLAEADALADRMYRSALPIVAISTEMSLPILPADPEQQRLVRLAASANQMFAALAGNVVLMVSGVPLRVR